MILAQAQQVLPLRRISRLLRPKGWKVGPAKEKLDAT